MRVNTTIIVQLFFVGQTQQWGQEWTNKCTCSFSSLVMHYLLQCVDHPLQALMIPMVPSLFPKHRNILHIIFLHTSICHLLTILNSLLPTFFSQIPPCQTSLQIPIPTPTITTPTPTPTPSSLLIHQLLLIILVLILLTLLTFWILHTLLLLLTTLTIIHLHP